MWGNTDARTRALAVIAVLALALTAGCGGGKKEHPGISAAATASAAATEFGKAYDAFQTEFRAGTAIAAGDAATLAERTAAVRAVRTAFFDFDAAVRKIEVPAKASDDVDAMYAAIAALIKQFDIQGAATTAAAFRAENTASSAAYSAADAAIMKVLETLGVDKTSPSSAAASPVSTQTPVSPSYLKDGKIEDAAAWRDDLLAIGLANVDEDNATSTSDGIVESWIAAFPGVLPDSGIVGTQIEAPKNGVSGFSILNSKSAGQSYLAFAASDAKGGCAGGVISGSSTLTTTKPVSLRAGKPCSAYEVAVAAGLSD